MNVEEGGADQGPDGRRIRAALTSAKPWLKITVLGKGLADAKVSFEFVPGLLEGGGVNKDNVFVETFGSAEQAGDGR